MNFDGVYRDQRWRIVIVVASAVVMGLMSGCSQDDGHRNFPPSANGQDDQQTNDSGDVGGDTENDNREDADPQDPDANQQDPDANDGNGDNNGNGDNDSQPIDSNCGPLIDLGELGFGNHTQTVDFDDFDNELTASCGGGAAMNAGVYQFTPASSTPGILTVDTGGEAVAELRAGFCDSADAVVACGQESLVMVPQTNVIHNLIIEPLTADDFDTVEVELHYEELLECTDEQGNQVSEQRECIDDTTLEGCQFMRASPDVSREFTIDCPTGECSDDRCTGDNCDHPIPVSSSFEWTGSTVGFFDNYGGTTIGVGGEESTCKTEDGNAFLTPGYDLFFELQDVSAGDQVTIDIDTEFQDELVVSVKKDCTDPLSCHQVWAGQQEMEFDAPSDDTLYLVVDSQLESDAFYDISIDIEAQ